MRQAVTLSIKFIAALVASSVLYLIFENEIHKNGIQGSHEVMMAAADAPEKTVSDAELKQHSIASTLWLAVHGRVYDVTEFLHDHPGGQQALLQAAGGDATAAFDRAGHHPNYLKRFGPGLAYLPSPSQTSRTPSLKLQGKYSDPHHPNG